MLFVRELNVKEGLGDPYWAPLREYLTIARKLFPKVNAKLLRSPFIGSDKVYWVEEGWKSMAEGEQSEKTFWEDAEVKKVAKRVEQLQKEHGILKMYSPYRDFFIWDCSDKEPK
ncbi:MAG: hypothetical protein A2177_05175 [Spirochaetes bacterium RBG_13_68_11]|nr:MAG: hypothetical protein A2177_05175 [Spirochaetes bacterium RBG_13_68_11]